MSNRGTTRRLLWAAGVLLLGITALLWWRGQDDSAAAGATHGDRADSAALAQARRLEAIHRARAAMDEALPLLAIRGRVVDRNDDPVPAAMVVLAHPARATLSGPDGSFAIAGLPPGIYAIEARKGSQVGGPHHVELADATEPVTLRMRSGAALTVEVVSAGDERPIAGAEVAIELLSMYEAAGAQRAATGADGTVTFEGVTLVAHELYIHAPGYIDARDTFDPKITDGDRARLRFELQPGVTVAGRVVGPGGAPVEGAIVETMPNERGGSPRTQSDRSRYGAAPAYMQGMMRHGFVTGADGRFQIGVSPGLWLIAASHPRYEAGAETVRISGSDPVDDVEIVLDHGVVVTGLVVTADDAPVPGALVEARWQFGGNVDRRVQADGTGRFEITGLPPAPLELIARTDAGSSNRVLIDLSEAGAQTEDVVLQLVNDGAITGTLLSGGRPVEAGQVFYVETSPPSKLKIHSSVVNTNAAGRFRIDGIASDREYSLTAMPHQDGDWWVRATDVRARAGDDVTIQIPADGSIRGRVVRDDGKPVTGVSVDIVGSTEPRPVSRSGAFAFENIPPRRHTLRLWAPDAPEMQIVVELEPGEDEDLGTIRLPRGREVSGVVLYESGGPAALVDVAIALPDGLTLREMTDDEGRFTATVPADVPLEVTARHRKGGHAALTVPPDQPATGLTLVFTGTGSVEGDVTSGGQPAVGLLVALRETGSSPHAQPLAYGQTDDAGYFRLEMLAPGAYDLEVWVADPDTHASARYIQLVTVAQGERAFASVDVSEGVAGGQSVPPVPEDQRQPEKTGGGGGGHGPGGGAHGH